MALQEDKSLREETLEVRRSIHGPVVAINGEQAVFVLSYIGDEERDAVELADALVDHTNTAVGDESYRFIRQDGDMVIWILADDPAAGAAVRTALAP